MKTITLCADDYAQSPAISAGILRLIETGRLSATGCMTQGPAWEMDGRKLAAHAGKVDIGLHFNLTHAFAGARAQTLGCVLRGALTRTLDLAQVAETFKAQLDRFESVMGRRPDFVDGHQHVHVLPGIREVVLAQLAKRYPNGKPYLRAVNPTLRLRSGFPKEAFLRWLGAGFEKDAARMGFITNRGFGGIYSLAPTADFAGSMARWLSEAQDGGLIMCHPGLAAEDAGDPIAATRPVESAFLGSSAFGEVLERNGVRLARLAADQGLEAGPL